MGKQEEGRDKCIYNQRGWVFRGGGVSRVPYWGGVIQSMGRETPSLQLSNVWDRGQGKGSCEYPLGPPLCSWLLIPQKLQKSSDRHPSCLPSQCGIQLLLHRILPQEYCYCAKFLAHSYEWPIFFKEHLTFPVKLCNKRDGKNGGANYLTHAIRNIFSQIDGPIRCPICTKNRTKGGCVLLFSANDALLLT